MFQSERPEANKQGESHDSSAWLIGYRTGLSQRMGVGEKDPLLRSCPVSASMNQVSLKDKPPDDLDLILNGR